MELIQDKPSQGGMLQNSVENALASGGGIVFTTDAAAADYHVELSTNVNKSAQAFGQVIAILSGSVTVTERSTGKVIYSKAIANMKGFGLDVDRACAKAYENAAKEIRGSVVLEVMQAIRYEPHKKTHQ